MGELYRDISPFSKIIGSLFYHDPVSRSGVAVRKWLALAHAEEMWEYGLPESTRAIEALILSSKNTADVDLHREFNRLFIGPYSLPAPPWGSVYTDPESVLFGNATLGVRSWMRENAVKLHLQCREPEDHFGLMMLLVAWATENDVDDEQITELLQSHLMPWAFRFLDLFEEGADLEYYSAAARLARVTLADWRDRFGFEAADVRLAR